MPKYDLEEMVKQDLLQVGDVILTYSPLRPIKDPISVVSFLIRKITNSKWSHAALYVGDGFIIEANPKGVEKRYLPKRYKGYDISIWRHKKIDELDKVQLRKDAKSYIGKKYDYPQILDLLYLFAFRNRWKSRREAGKSNQMICSEVASKPFYNQNQYVMKKLTYDKVAPADFSRSVYFKRKDFESRIQEGE